MKPYQIDAPNVTDIQKISLFLKRAWQDSYRSIIPSDYLANDYCYTV